MATDYFSTISWATVASQRYENYWTDCLDWREWREAYEGGRIFRDRYLEKFSDREEWGEWMRRIRTTPILTYAKRGINRIRDNMAMRFVDIIRRGGSQSYQDAVDGKGRGVDNRGSSMNDWIQAKILSDLFVIGRIGTLVDAPKLENNTADAAQGFQPYVYHYPVEQILDLHRADSSSESDFDAVLLCDHVNSRNKASGKVTFEKRYKYLFIDEKTEKVVLQYIDLKGNPVDSPQFTELTKIPFVLWDIGQSLMKDISSLQITMLNVSSTVANYALESNFPLYRKQEDSNPFDENNNHPAGKVSDQQGPSPQGVRKGVRYAPKMNAPDFTAPPTGPMTASREYLNELRDQTFELIDASIAEKDPKGRGDLDAGLAWIGGRMQSAEARIADHWAAYISSTEMPVIKYPEEWRVRPLLERLEEAEKATGIIFKFPGRETKQVMAAHIFTRLMRGAVSSEELAKCIKAITESDLTTSDPDLILALKEQGSLDVVTVLVALGVDPEKAQEIAKKANGERAERMAEMQQAQMAQDSAGRGNDDFSGNPTKDAADDKAASRNTDDKPTTEAPVRGEAKKIEE